MDFLLKGVAGNVNIDSPGASMYTGVIAAVSDWELRYGGFLNNQVVRHSMLSSSGASDSLIFNTKGAVVAINNAGSVAGRIDTQTSEGKGSISIA